MSVNLLICFALFLFCKLTVLFCKLTVSLCFVCKRTVVFVSFVLFYKHKVSVNLLFCFVL